MHLWLKIAFFVILLGGILGCVAAEEGAAPLPVLVSAETKAPTPTLFSDSQPLIAQPLSTQPLGTQPLGTQSPATNPPNATAIAVSSDTDWQLIESGLEQRTIDLFDDSNRLIDTLMLLRIDPNFFQFDVAYTPTQPKLLDQWLQDTGALIVVNGGFFTAEFYATGLTIADGAATGQSYDFGGMVAIQNGYPTVRSLSQQPYDVSEAADAGLQAFPMLVQPGGKIGFDEETGRRARRTVIAQDTAGQIVLLISTRTNFTLYELSRYLVNSDLNIDRALNLDGGPSSGLRHRDGIGDVEAFVLLPTVLTINRR